MRVSCSTVVIAWLLLPRGLTATTNDVFDVSRSSRITCQTKNDGCTLNGSFGSQERQGFFAPDRANNPLVYKSDGQSDSYLELANCWDFDCTAECDASCSCVNLATNQACPTAGDETPLAPRPEINLEEPHLFHALQDVRLECTKSRTKCVVSGFQGCGYTVPRYNLYNEDSGLFHVQNISRGDTELELRGCNPALGSAECDAGCTCHDLATNEPCEFTVLPPRPAPPVSTQSPKIVFSGLREATLTCKVENARCDEINGSNTCGSSSSGPSGMDTTSSLQPAALRVDHVKRGANSVTFSACYHETPFSMECDSGCTCIDANTGLPCHCTNASGKACTIQQAGTAPRIVALAVGGLLVLLGLVMSFSCLLSRRKGGSSKAAEYSLVHKKEIENLSLEVVDSK